MISKATMRSMAIILLAIVQTFLFCACSVTKAQIEPRIEVNAYSESTFEIKEPLELEMQCDRGDVEVYTWDKKYIKFEITKRLRGNEEKSILLQKLKEFDINITQSESKVFLKSYYSGKDKKSIESIVDLIIYIPKSQFALNWKQSRGNIKFLDDIKGVINFNLVSANLEINKFDGIIKVQSDSGNVRISNGRLYGQCSIIKNTGNIDMKSKLEENGDYSLCTNAGNIDLLIERNCPISVESIGTLEINEFEEAYNLTKLKISSSMGKISIRKY